MVFECTSEYPTPEGAEQRCPPPRSTYGFQKLATEYFAKGAREQYSLPFTIVRPFNCVGIGERRALRDVDVFSGNVKLAMSHVVPDLAQKVLKGADPLHIRQKEARGGITPTGEIWRVGFGFASRIPTRSTRTSICSTAARRPYANWQRQSGKKAHCGARSFRCVHDPAYEYDVQERSPSVAKAEQLLGFRAETTLSDIL